MLILTLTRTLPQMSVSNLAAHGKFIAADTIIIVSKKLWIKKNLYFCQKKLRKRSKLLRMNNDLLVEYVLGYELAIYRVFWSSAFCITSNNSFCIAKVLIFSHFTKNSQRKNSFRSHFG